MPKPTFPPPPQDPAPGPPTPAEQWAETALESTAHDAAVYMRALNAVAKEAYPDTWKAVVAQAIEGAK